MMCKGISNKIIKKRIINLLCLTLFFCIISLSIKPETYFASDEGENRYYIDTGGENVHYIFDEQKEPLSKVVYLTFDDGPCFVITNKILDVLHQQDVRATFFVVGKEIKGKEEMLKRIHRNRHGIGLHTFTHNFKKIYRSQESFIQEMTETASLVNEILGITPTAIRFPGGSSGVLNAELLKKLHENKFKVYDWTVNIGDGINAKLSPERLVENAKKIKGNPNTVIILAHFNSNNKNTYKALPGIIKFYREQGYEFRSIDEKTPEYYYRLKKK